ncbi:phosphotransferase [Microbacterium sp. 18062]|uniref:phosphotransferase n=1 Tax=Microbacterium sp. 18062 TaxID=2681410 RepID=UPI00135CDA8A|nr:phosphotransferase [Microbacterium sp. 18062]
MSHRVAPPEPAGLLESTPPDAGGPVESALLADALGIPVERMRPIHRSPMGAGSIAGFEVRQDDGPPVTAYVDTSRLPVPAETGLALADHARVWLHPADPHLPALAPIAFGSAAAALLDRIGVHTTGPVRLVAYRPARRAVAAVPTDEGTLWAKVVPPDRVERIAGLHETLRAAGLPVPAVRCWAPDGLIVLENAAGRAATEIGWRPGPLAAAVDALRERLATVATGMPPRAGIDARLDWYEGRLVRAAPAWADTVRRVADAARTAAPADRPQTVHGDLHLGQLFLDDRARIVGLVDLDTVAPGDAADDEAAFIGHAIASAGLTPDAGAAGRMRRLAAGLQARWGGHPRTRSLTLVHLLGHALTAAESGHEEHLRSLLGTAMDLPDGT